MDHKSVLVIGAGLSGLTTAALLSKSGFTVKVVEKSHQPGGSSGAFKRNGNIFDIGSAMMFGFGETGFNPHTLLFNEIEEPIEVIPHKAMYRMHYGDEVITFWNDFDSFYKELERIFPYEIDNIKRYYAYLDELYSNVIMKDPSLIAPSEIPQEEMIKKFKKDPIAQIRTLPLLFRNASSILYKFTRNKDVINFFNKITSTYSYTTVDETPAIMSVTMFMENHKSGSYYIHGSTQVYVGKLEKAIEKYGGELIYGREVVSLKEENKVIKRAALDNGETIDSDYFVFSGTVYNLYSKLLVNSNIPKKLKDRFLKFERSPSSLVMYTLVEKEALPKDILAEEMLVQNKEALDETEVTLYTTTVDDPFLNINGMHNVIAIGPSFRKWPHPDEREYADHAFRANYEQMKKEEAERIINYIDSHFPGFKNGVRYYEIGTPSTIERYTLKNFGSVAGPKQKIGQELLKRHHAATFFDNLFMCGESTVMGTGTPAVVVSGISAADMILRKEGLEEYRYAKDKGFVRYLSEVKTAYPEKNFNRLANLCQWCEQDNCREACPYSVDVRGILRRLYVDNIYGAKKLLKFDKNDVLSCLTCDKQCEKVCKRINTFGKTVPISNILEKLNKMEEK